MTSTALVRWSALSEPGDGLAGLVLRQFGAELALEQFQAKRARASWAELLREEHPGYLPRIDETLERFALRWPATNPVELLRAAQRVGAKPIDSTSAPALWRQFEPLAHHAPAMLWLAGEPDLNKVAVSVVGTRVPTDYGLTVTQDLVSRLADYTVVSGGAKGIDAAAHLAALAESGTTIAYLAGGIDRAYPREHEKLFHEIVLGGGALLAETAPGTSPTRWRFLQRNRLIAAHGELTVIVEAGYKSGARNTAARAIDCGRPLYAVPGQITSSASATCNDLIAQQRATALTDIGAFVAELAGQTPALDFEASLTSDQQRVLDALGFRTQSVENIARESGLGVIQCRVELDRLVVMGLISGGDDRYKRVGRGL
jgi:DNA processing protein